jgi:hypothetical protein
MLLQFKSDSRRLFKIAANCMSPSIGNAKIVNSDSIDKLTKCLYQTANIELGRLAASINSAQAELNLLMQEIQKFQSKSAG